MRIIAHAGNLFNSEKFQEMIKCNKNIAGMSFDVTSTKDGKIVIFSPAPNNSLSIGGLQNSTSDSLTAFNIPTLEELLKAFQDYKKIITLNLLPFGTPALSEDTAAKINKQNLEYVQNVQKVIKDYPFLNIYLSSTNENIVHHLSNNIHPFKVGMALQSDNLNYMDVGFYKIGTDMINIPIIDEQIKRKKEIVLNASNCENMALLLEFLKSELNNLSEETKQNFQQKIIFESNFPEIFYCIFGR